MFKIPTPILRQYAVILTVNLLTLCVGMNGGWASPMMVKLRDPAETPLSRPITEDEGGWIVSIGSIFSIFLLPCVSLLMDHIGRRYSVLVVCFPKIVAGMLTIFATEVWMLLAARTINGVTSAGALMIIVVYATEISSKEVRGSQGAFLSIFSNLGMLMMLGIGPYISYLNVSIMVTAVTVCVMIPLLFIPDTPYSLCNKGKIEEAKKVLIYFRGSEALAEEELKELSQTEPGEKIKTREIFKNKIYLKSLLLVLILSIGVQCTGFNIVMFYLQTILELSNTSVSSALGSVIIGVIQLTSSFFTSLIIDRFGRIPILVTTLLAMAAGMILLGSFFIIKQRGVISGWHNFLPLTGIAIITVSYSGGLGSLYFVIVTELLDGPIRATGTGMAATVTNILIFLLSRYAMTMLSAIGADTTFIVFGVLCIVMSLFIFFCVPETKNKTIAEIQKALGAKKEDEQSSDCVSRF